MAAEDVVVYWDCHNCKAHGRLDMQRVVEVLGPDFSLWDQMRRCERCVGVVSFSAAYRAGNWPIVLLSPEGERRLMAALDDLWWERAKGGGAH